MNKYIDAEKLKEEIERRRNSALTRQKNLEKIGQETVLNEMIAAELNRLISFIDSLQQEQPETDLEKEITRTYHDGSVADTSDMDHNDYENIARHFAEWQYQKDRVEFAKLKAREWINGYDEGYAKGLNARKEDK